MLRRRGFNPDSRLVELGALLHDIGRSKTHGVKHGYYGGRVAQAYKLPSNVVKIIERHVGAGIPAAEARSLGLPNRDFTPETLEEKIVAYADKRIGSKKIISCEEALEDLARSLGDNHPAISRLKSLFGEVARLLGEDSCHASH